MVYIGKLSMSKMFIQVFFSGQGNMETHLQNQTDTEYDLG